MATIIVLLIISGFMHAARSFAPAGVEGAPAGTTMALGYLLLAAHLGGNLFKSIHLPRLTGYLVTGLVVGPTALNLVSQEMVINLRIFNGIAIALIALTAGCEMEFKTFRPQLRSIAWITLIAVFGTTSLLALTACLIKPMLPFMSSLQGPALLATAAVLGATMVAQSPAVTVALRGEMRADGPLMRTVLGVVVISDLFVILLFAIASSVAHATLGGGAEVTETAISLAREIFGSIVAGIIIGFLVSVLLRRAMKGGALFILAIGFAIAEVGQRVQLDPLLIALAMGLFVRNATKYGDRLLQAIEGGSLPVYVAFFAVAGATIRVDLLWTVGIPAAIFAIVRGTGFIAGTRLAGRVAGAPGEVRRFGGLGLIPQSGLALALALLFTRTFPHFGEPAATLVFAIVGINELIGPVLFRAALVRTGEAGQLSGHSESLAKGGQHQLFAAANHH